MIDSSSNNQASNWTFLTNHAHVIVCLSLNSDMPLREVAMQVGITERAVQKIVKDLEESGVLKIGKTGRCNNYQINTDFPLRHSLEQHCTIGSLLNMVKRANKTTDSEIQN